MTLPSQLLEDDEAAANETLTALANDGSNGGRDGVQLLGRTSPSPLTTREEEEEEEDGEEDGEDKGKKVRAVQE